MACDMSKVEAVLTAYPNAESSLVMILQDIQASLRYLPDEALARVAEHLGIPATRVFGVATFYKVFSRKPQGRTLIQICKGTACHVRGAQLLEDEVCRKLGINVGETTADMSYTVKSVNCVGACAMAPVLIVDETYHGKVKPTRVQKLLGRGGVDDETH